MRMELHKIVRIEYDSNLLNNREVAMNTVSNVKYRALRENPQQRGTQIYFEGNRVDKELSLSNGTN